jgi:hypothetical protein
VSRCLIEGEVRSHAAYPNTKLDATLSQSQSAKKKNGCYGPMLLDSTSPLANGPATFCFVRWDERFRPAKGSQNEKGDPVVTEPPHTHDYHGKPCRPELPRPDFI